MGFFDKFKKQKKPAKPAAVAAAFEPGVICAPVSGTVIELSQVDDPVFSSGAMGKGIAVYPSEDVIYAPVSGIISATTPTLHALGLTTDDGVEVLIHVGIDTVEMKGDGFTGFVEKGQKVAAGDALMTFDRAKIEAAGYKDTVIMAVTNTDDLAAVTPVEPGAIRAGQKAISYTK